MLGGVVGSIELSTLLPSIEKEGPSTSKFGCEKALAFEGLACKV